ncbi:MAG: tetratricopeptide repeat-containing sulfotransferase family protein [Phycisphaerales bacterium JB040]
MPQPYPEPTDERTVPIFVALRDGDPLRARLLAEEAARDEPGNQLARFYLAQALTRTNAPRKALPIVRRLVRADPHNTWYRCELAHALEATGKPEDALKELDDVLEREPDHHHAARLHTSILRNLGRSKEAWDALHHRLDRLPDTANVAVALASVLPSDGDAEDVIARLRRAVHDESTTREDKRTALYHLARILDARARYDEAFEAAADAGELVNTHTAGFHARVLESHTPELCAAVEPADVDASGVVLVCGMPRSGTTVHESILSAHPDAASAGEFGGLPRAVHEAEVHAREHAVTPAELSTRLARQYLKALRSAARAPRARVLIDKLPSNHFLLGIGARLLPGVRVVRCLRDPRDTAVSCFLQDFGDRHPYRISLPALAEELTLHDRAAQRWRSELGDAYLESRLEELIEHPEDNARRLLGHAGLEWDPACLDFHESVGQVRTASTSQVRRGLNARGVGRWRHYERHLRPLLEHLPPLPGGDGA